MTDPRYTDPAHSRLEDPMLQRDQARPGAWAWVAGITVLALVAFVLIASWSGDSNTTASNDRPATATSSAPASTTTPPSTTGSGATSPRPMAPPANTAPAPNGAR